MKKFLVLLTLSTFVGHAANARMACEDLYRPTPSARTWTFLQRTEAVKLVSEFQKPLPEVYAGLQFPQKIRLRYLLRTYNPQTDFLVPRNVDHFVSSTLRILDAEGSPFIDRHPEVHALRRAALNQLVRTYVTEQAKKEKIEPSSVKLKAFRIFAWYRLTPPAVFTNSFATLPIIRSKNVHSETIDAFLSGKLDQNLDALEIAAARKQIRIETLREYRTYANLVAMTVSSIIFYHWMEESWDFYKKQMDRITTEGFEKYVSGKLDDTREATANLLTAKKAKEDFEKDPVAGYEAAIIKDQFTDKGLTPSAQDLKDIREIATELAQERAQKLATN